jgi:hypothetical protein
VGPVLQATEGGAGEATEPAAAATGTDAVAAPATGRSDEPLAERQLLGELKARAHSSPMESAS